MNLFNYYWWYSKALSNETCDSIIELGNLKNNKSQLGVIGNTRKDVDKKPLSEKEKQDLFKWHYSSVVSGNPRSKKEKIISFFFSTR